MALLFFDGFDHYATADILRKWTNFAFTVAAGIVTSPTRFGVGQSMCLAADGQYAAPSAYKYLRPTGSTFIIGFAARFTSIRPYRLVNLHLGSGFQISTIWTGTGLIEVYRGNGWSGGGTLLGTTSAGCTAGIWYYIEMKFVIGAAGSVEVRINGAPVLTLPSVNTQNLTTANWDNFALFWDGGPSQNEHLYLDDVYVCDGSGALCNDFLGDCRVDTHWPTADGATHTFTPSTGTEHWSLVDETTPNDDTDYNAAGAAGAKDTFVVEDLKNPVATDIRGVQINMMAAKSSPGGAKVGAVVRHAGVDNDAAGQSVGAGSYIDYCQLYEQNPNGGSPIPWTVSGFNNAEFGYKRTA